MKRSQAAAHKRGKKRSAGKARPRLSPRLWWPAAFAGACLLLLVGGLVVVGQWPSLGAQGADFLRGVIGDRAVARLEEAAYRAGDAIQKWKFDLGLSRPTAPWETPTASVLAAGTTPAASPISMPASGRSESPTASTEFAAPTPTSAAPAPSPEPPAAWQPQALQPLGSLAGEGVWSAYIQDASGRTVAYRTYLQPDPDRPYALVAVVAFDLAHTRLHFVLGSVEPNAPESPKRSGAMPAADKAPGYLLAMFNGGFKARHGHFGAMADGVVALPARDGLGTLAIYRDGSLRLDEWGTGISASPDMIAWRQNGPLVIRKGRINPLVNNQSPEDWGFTTVSGLSPTWRSGVGLSADRLTLYYFCGPSLSVEALAKAMQAAGAENAIQLDINPYWVHFVAVRADGSKLVFMPLFPGMMKENLDRYLWGYVRDYFYVTGLP